MSALKRLTQFLEKIPRLADFLALTGFVTFGFSLWTFTRIQVSVMDEGLYLFKGWLFATGKYIPFQDFGLWTNQMPLAFLIPGWVERIFGFGLRTGRDLAFVLGLLMALGLWMTARRLSNRWIAAGLVWAVALNPAVERMYGTAASQVLLACLLAWTMFFTLGKDRKNWQLLIGGILAGAAVMVRINIILLLPLLVFYGLWEYPHGGAKTKNSLNLRAPMPLWLKSPLFWLVFGMLISFGGIHLLYWPGILRLWARWLPLPFLSPWFPPPNTPTWQPDAPLGFRVASLFLAFRYHFAALMGSLAAVVFWPRMHRTALNGMGSSKNDVRLTDLSNPTGAMHFSNRKVAIFLGTFLLSSFLLHAWASLGNEYCVFCFPTYTSFYSGAGLLLVAVTVRDWVLNIPAWRKWLGGLGMLFLLGGMAYSVEGTFESLMPENFYKRILTLPVPGFSGAQIWQIVANKFGMEWRAVFDAFHAWFPVTVAMAFGLVILAAGKLLVGRKNSGAFGAGFLILTIMGTLFSPSRLLAGEYNSYDCGVDVISGYETAGAALAKVIPPRSKVYWAGYSPVTLLYIPGVEIFPAQLHGTYSLRISDDDEALRRYGWWNQSLAKKWLAEADFVLVEQKNLGDWLSGFELVTQTASPTCSDENAMLVFRRK